MTVTLTHQNPVSIVTLTNQPLNLLDIESMDALVAAHQEADGNDRTRVIITRSGVPGVFSNGLDPHYVLNFAADRRVEVFKAVGRMVSSLLELRKPHITLIEGPAMAGGAVLAIPADFRFMEASSARLSFSEPKVGLPIPEPIAKIIAFFCAPQYLRDVVMLGKNLDAQAALTAGLADGLAEGGEALEAMAGKHAERLSRISPTVLAATKRGLRGHLFESARAFAHDPGSFTEFVGDEFLGEGLSALVEERFPRFVR